MTTKHTPGPWRITDDYITVWTDNGPDKEDFQIASLDSEGAPEIDGPTSTANAYLIAAAPELLAACNEAFDLIARVRCAVGHGLMYESAVQLENIMRTAISKANGE